MKIRHRNVKQLLFLMCSLLLMSADSFGYTMQDAGISQRAQNYINTMQYSDAATSHIAFQNCLKDINSTEKVPGDAEEITSEAQLERIRPGGTYVLRGNLTFTRVFNVPSDVTLYVDGSIHRNGTFSAPGAIYNSENDTDAIFMVKGKKNIKIIGVNNAQLTGSWTTGKANEPGTTAAYITKSSYVTIEGFDIGFVWEGLVARGNNHHIYFLNNYIHDTRKRAVWLLTSQHCEIVHNFIENAGCDGIDFDAYVYDNIAFENIVIGVGRWIGFTEEGAKRNDFVRNVGIMAYFGNPNTGYQMGWVDNGAHQSIVDNGGSTEENYFIANICIHPTQFTGKGSGNYSANLHAEGGKGQSYFWGNGEYGVTHNTSGKHWYRAQWLDTIPPAGQQLIDELDTKYNPSIGDTPSAPTRLRILADE